MSPTSLCPCTPSSSRVSRQWTLGRPTCPGQTWEEDAAQGACLEFSSDCTLLASWEKEERGFQSFLRREEGVQVIYKTNPRRAPSVRPFAGAAATPAGRGRGAAGSAGADGLGISGDPPFAAPGSLAAPSLSAEERPPRGRIGLRGPWGEGGASGQRS